MVTKRSAHRNPIAPEMFYATGIAYERDAQRVSKQFLKSHSASTDKIGSGK